MRSPARAFLAVALLVACDLPFGLGDAGETERLQENRALWARRGHASYDLTLRRACFCGNVEPVIIGVRNGERATTVYAESGNPVPQDEARWYPTVPGLFDVVADALRRDAHQLTVLYDPQLGYPQYVSIDYRANVADDEVTYTVSAIVPR